MSFIEPPGPIRHEPKPKPVLGHPILHIGGTDENASSFAPSHVGVTIHPSEGGFKVANAHTGEVLPGHHATLAEAEIGALKHAGHGEAAIDQRRHDQQTSQHPYGLSRRNYYDLANKRSLSAFHDSDPHFSHHETHLRR